MSREKKSKADAAEARRADRVGKAGAKRGRHGSMDPSALRAVAGSGSFVGHSVAGKPDPGTPCRERARPRRLTWRRAVASGPGNARLRLVRACELLREQKSEIMDEWAHEVRRLAPAAGLTTLALLDHMPNMLADVATWLAGEESAVEPSFHRQAAKHAVDRLGHDFNITELVHEYSTLRGILLRHIEEARCFDPQEIMGLNRAIDAAIAAAVERYAELSGQTIREQSERTRLALEASQLGTWEFNPQTGAFQWDALSRTLLGLPDDAPRDLESLRAVIHPEDRDRVERVVQELASGRTECEVEFRAIGLRDGPERWIEGRGRVIARDESGRPMRVTGVNRDITRRKHGQKARETFLAIVGHDLRNPLNTVAFSARTLLLSPTLDQPNRHAAERITRAGERMARMIDDVVDFATAQLGRGVAIKPQHDDMRAICTQIIEEIASAHPDRNIALETSGDLGGRWDRDRVMQALENIVGNAIKYGQDPIRVTAKRVGEHVVVEVWNAGNPIPPDVLGRIFDPFARGSRGTDVPDKGLGLGLFIACQIVQTHGGSIDVRSDESGTTFCTRWPVAPAAASLQQPQAPTIH